MIINMIFKVVCNKNVLFSRTFMLGALYKQSLPSSTNIFFHLRVNSLSVRETILNTFSWLPQHVSKGTEFRFFMYDQPYQWAIFSFSKSLSFDICPFSFSIHILIITKRRNNIHVVILQCAHPSLIHKQLQGWRAEVWRLGVIKL